SVVILSSPPPRRFIVTHQRTASHQWHLISRMPFKNFPVKSLLKLGRIGGATSNFLWTEKLPNENQAAPDALAVSEKDKLLDLLGCLGPEGLRRFQMTSSWNINHLDDPNNPRTLDQALSICDDLFGVNVHPMDSDGSEEVSHVAEKGPGRINLVRKQRSPSATCDKRGKEDNKDVDPSRLSTLRDKKCSSCGIPGHHTDSCRKAAQRPSRDSQTARQSTVLKHHPSADAAHDDGRIRCTISLQPIPNISLQQRRQGPQQAQIWAGTGADVSTLTEGWFRTHFPDEVMQPTTKIFKAFNGAC
ncbi:MAG: hypothetical protein GY696_34840, partial [Gammaproteobacteria bacterium]|nr:hypothetical protein [Gammaproteobacteria bacterium]